MRTIKDIIDAERWEISGGIDDEVIQLRHNVSLARIEDAVTKRIAELEAQVPKVISPKNGTCMCGNVVRGFDPVHYGWKNNYCPNCGAKLNWEEA